MIAEIPGWPGYYATDCGRIVSFWSRRMVPGFNGGARAFVGEDGRELSSFDRKDRRGNPTGYRSVCLSRAGKSRNFYVHELVLYAFVGPRPSGDHQVLHGNGERDDNRLANLRWGTVQENADDRELHDRVLRGADWHRARRAAASDGVLVDEIAPYSGSREYEGAFDDLIGAAE